MEYPNEIFEVLRDKEMLSTMHHHKAGERTLYFFGGCIWVFGGRYEQDIWLSPYIAYNIENIGKTNPLFRGRNYTIESKKNGVTFVRSAQMILELTPKRSYNLRRWIDGFLKGDVVTTGYTQYISKKLADEVWLDDLLLL